MDSDRQADMQDATSVENAHELARLCHVAASSADCPGIPFCGCKCDQMRCSVEVVEGSCVLRESKCGLLGCRVGEASNPGSRVKRRRVESSSPQSGSDFSNLLDCLEEELGVVAPTDIDPATTDASHSATQRSRRIAVPASSRALREVHPGGISVPIEVPTLPGGSVAGQSAASVLWKRPDLV